MDRILVIEDELSIRTGIAEILRFEGYLVDEAGDGRTGYDLAIQNFPDLILCDIMMPDTDGFETLRMLSSNDETKLIPFIYLTALANRSDMRKGMTLGANDFLTKPFSREDLLNVVKTRLRKSGEYKSMQKAAMDELRHNVITSLPHELNTPLNGLMGFGQLLRDHAETFSLKELKEAGEYVYASSMRLYRLIQNYLYYVRMEVSPRESMEHYRLKNPGFIASKIASELAKKYDRIADLDCQYDKCTAYITENEFYKVVEEIADNAFKFSSPGKKVTLSALFENGLFRMTVGDQGNGIEPSEVRKIGAYMQFDRNTKEQQGSGLGLAVVGKIIELFHGTFNVTSRPGEGTTVEVGIPGHSDFEQAKATDLNS